MGRGARLSRPALAEGNIGSWALLSLTCAKLFTTVQDSDRGNARVVKEVVQTYSSSNDGRTYTFELKQTFRFDTGARVTAQSFVAAFNRAALMRVPGGWDDRAHAGGERWLHPGHHRGRSSHPGTVESHLRRAGARPLPPPDPPEASGGRSGPSLDDAVLLPDSARNAPDRIGTIHRDRALPRRRPHHEPAHRPGTESYYGGGRIANPDRILWTIESNANLRLQAIKQDRHDYLLLFNYPEAVVRDLVRSTA